MEKGGYKTIEALFRISWQDLGKLRETSVRTGGAQFEMRTGNLPSAGWEVANPLRHHQFLPVRSTASVLQANKCIAWIHCACQCFIHALDTLWNSHVKAQFEAECGHSKLPFINAAPVNYFHTEYTIQPDEGWPNTDVPRGKREYCNS